MEMEKIARWAFAAFVIIAIIMGLVVGSMADTNASGYSDTDAYVTLILLILGVIVGLISITAKEVTPYLIAAIAIIVASSANVWLPLDTINSYLYYWATYILRYIVAFTAPAAVIIAIKALLAMERAK
jgi:hypothetical protein